MPNAKDLNQKTLHQNILLLGYTGSGKTAQVLTLPGRTFVYVFDPSALTTLAGADLDYEMFVPSKLNIAAQSLSKGKSDRAIKGIDSHEVYPAFADHLSDGIDSGLLEQYDNIVLDSFTTFSDCVMDRVLYLNGRAGQQPQQDDWAAQMTTIKSVVRELVGLKKRLLATGHVEFKQDEETSRMMNVIMLTGRLRTSLPLLFSDILMCDVDPKDNSRFVFLTRKDKHNPQIRCSLRDERGDRLPPVVDATIEDWSNPQGSGLGRILQNGGYKAKTT